MKSHNISISRISPSLREAIYKELAAKDEITALNDKLFDLKQIMKQSRQIVSEVKRDTTVSEIVSKIESLVEKLNLDEYALDDFEDIKSDVSKAKDKLESAVFELDIFFDGIKRSLEDKIYELEIEEGIF